MSDYSWTDYNCEGCRQYKKLRKRKSDGKMLCKKCSKNKSLTMAIKLNSEKADKTCATKHVIPPNLKRSGILPNFI